MQVKVRDLLPTVITGVRNQAPALVQTLRARDARRDRKESTSQSLVIEFPQALHMRPRQDQQVHGGLWANVADDHTQLVFVDTGRGHASLDNAAEDAGGFHRAASQLRVWG